MIPERTVNTALMCEARENRAELQKKYLAAFGLTLISFTLNIPGDVKDGDLYRKAHREGMKTAGTLLRSRGRPVVRKKIRYLKTGTEGFFVVDAPAVTVKDDMMEIEQHHPLGRLFDFDVFEPAGTLLSRSDTMCYRTCYLCDNNAKECARSRAHPLELVLERIEILISNFFGGDPSSVKYQA